MVQRGVIILSEKDLTKKIIEQAGIMAKALLKGRDLEVRKSTSGISVAEVSKKVVAK